MGGWGFESIGSGLNRGRIDDALDLGDAVGGESSLFGMFSNHFLVGSEVHAINFVVRHVAVQPLNLPAQILNYAIGFLRNGLNLVLGQTSCVRDISLDHIYFGTCGSCRQ
jgi:hypothetical protein